MYVCTWCVVGTPKLIWSEIAWISLTFLCWLGTFKAACPWESWAYNLQRCMYGMYVCMYVYALCMYVCMYVCTWFVVVYDWSLGHMYAVLNNSSSMNSMNTLRRIPRASRLEKFFLPIKQIKSSQRMWAKSKKSVRFSPRSSQVLNCQWNQAPPATRTFSVFLGPL